MELKEGDTGIITFGDGTTAKVKLEKIQKYPSSGMPNDYFFTYQKGEVNKQIKHPEFGEEFPLPEFLVQQVFTKD